MNNTEDLALDKLLIAVASEHMIDAAMKNLLLAVLHHSDTMVRYQHGRAHGVIAMANAIQAIDTNLYIHINQLIYDWCTWFDNNRGRRQPAARAMESLLGLNKD